MVSDCKEKYPHIKRVYVRAEYADIDDSYKKYLLKNYEDTYFPEKVRNTGCAAYLKRNYEMINKSVVCVCYYDENYLPKRRKNAKKDLFGYQPRSGTRLAYEYAVKKQIKIINTL